MGVAAGSGCRGGEMRLGITRRDIHLRQQMVCSRLQQYLRSSLLSFPFNCPDTFHLSSPSLTHSHLALEA